MSTLFTHAFVGASIATLGDRSIPPAKLVVVAALLSVFPDVDVIGYGIGISYSHWLGHRGLTHSIPFAAVMAVASAWLLFPQARTSAPTFRRLSLLLFIAIASHGVIDAFTNAGLGVGFFIPFDNTRYFFPWRPLSAPPLSITRFFDGSPSTILLTELRWVVAPLFVLTAGAYLLRRRRARRAATSIDERE